MKIENKHKLLCSKKVTVQRMGKLDWQKVFAKHIFYKGLVFRIYKISHNLVIIKKLNLIKGKYFEHLIEKIYKWLKKRKDVQCYKPSGKCEFRRTKIKATDYTKNWRGC